MTIWLSIYNVEMLLEDTKAFIMSALNVLTETTVLRSNNHYDKPWDFVSLTIAQISNWNSDYTICQLHIEFVQVSWYLKRHIFSIAIQLQCHQVLNNSSDNPLFCIYISKDNIVFLFKHILDLKQKFREFKQIDQYFHLLNCLGFFVSYWNHSTGK